MLHRIALFSIFMGIMSCQSAEAEKTVYKVSGTVVDAETGEAIRGILVQGGRVEKNGQTTWGFSLKRRGRSNTFQESIRWDDGWRARVIAPGYKSQPILSERPKTDVVRGMVLKLVRGETVKGRVLDFANEPVAGASLFVVGARSINVHQGKAWKDSGTPDSEDNTVAKTMTDDQGRFTLTGIDDEFNRIAISAKAMDLWVVPAHDRAKNSEWVIKLPKPCSLTIDYSIRGGPQPATFMIQMATFERANWKYVESSRSVAVKNGAKLTLSNLPSGVFIVSRQKLIRTGSRGEYVFCEQQRVQLGAEPVSASYVRKGGSTVSGTVVGIPKAEKPEEQIKEALVYIRTADSQEDPRKRDYKKPTYEALVCESKGTFTTEQLAPGKYKAVAHAYRRQLPNAGFGGGIELPRLVGSADFTITGSQPPKPLRIELKPLK